MPIAVIGAVIISGVIYVLGSYALVTTSAVGYTSALAADLNPLHTAAKAFIPFVAPLITWVFLVQRDQFVGGGQHPPWLTIALIAAGIIYALVLGAVRPRVLEQAPALLEGSGDGEDPAPDPLAVSG